MKKKPNRGTETWRRMNNSIRHGSESRSPQKIISTYCEITSRAVVKVLESFPDNQKFHSCPTGHEGHL